MSAPVLVEAYSAGLFTRRAHTDPRTEVKSVSHDESQSRRARVSCLLALSLLAAVSCSDDTLDPDPGAAGSGGGAATFTQVYQALWPASSSSRCVLCHGMEPRDAINGAFGNIQDKAAAYAALVGKPAQGSACKGKGMYVVARSPQTSLLAQKLTATPPCGTRMPQGGEVSDATLELVTSWIMAGAQNN